MASNSSASGPHPQSNGKKDPNNRTKAALNIIETTWGVPDILSAFPPSIRPATLFGISAVSKVKSIAQKVPSLSVAQALFLNVCKDNQGKPVPVSYKHTAEVWSMVNGNESTNTTRTTTDSSASPTQQKQRKPKPQPVHLAHIPGLVAPSRHDTAPFSLGASSTAEKNKEVQFASSMSVKSDTVQRDYAFSLEALHTSTNGSTEQIGNPFTTATLTKDGIRQLSAPFTSPAPMKNAPKQANPLAALGSAGQTKSEVNELDPARPEKKSGGGAQAIGIGATVPTSYGFDTIKTLTNLPKKPQATPVMKDQAKISTIKDLTNVPKKLQVKPIMKDLVEISTEQQGIQALKDGKAEAGSKQFSGNESGKNANTYWADKVSSINPKADKVDSSITTSEGGNTEKDTVSVKWLEAEIRRKEEALFSLEKEGTKLATPIEKAPSDESKTPDPTARKETYFDILDRRMREDKIRKEQSTSTFTSAAASTATSSLTPTPTLTYPPPTTIMKGMKHLLEDDDDDTIVVDHPFSASKPSNGNGVIDTPASAKQTPAKRARSAQLEVPEIALPDTPLAKGGKDSVYAMGGNGNVLKVPIPPSKSTTQGEIKKKGNGEEPKFPVQPPKGTKSTVNKNIGQLNSTVQPLKGQSDTETLEKKCNDLHKRLATVLRETILPFATEKDTGLAEDLEQIIGYTTRHFALDISLAMQKAENSHRKLGEDKTK